MQGILARNNEKCIELGYAGVWRLDGGAKKGGKKAQSCSSRDIWKDKKPKSPAFQ